MTRFLAAALTLMLAAAGGTAFGSEPPLEAGVAVVDITPLPGYRMSGYFRERINTGTLDPLLAKAIVVKQGETEAAIVFCDLVGISLEVSNRIREIGSRLSGIPQEHIAVAATHSHTGPLYFGALRKHFHDRSVAETGSDPHELVDYPTELIGRVVRAVLSAQQSLQPVTLRAGYAHEDRLSFNRRFHMKNGSVKFNPGQLNPNILRAAGPIDPEVGLIAVAATNDAAPFAAIVSFALHLDTVGGTQYSADFPYHVQQHLRSTIGDEFLSLFGAGTCGDINHADVTVKGRRSAKEIGTMLADTIARRMPQLESPGRPMLAVRTAAVDATLQSYSPDAVREATQRMDRVDDRAVPFLERVEAYKIMALQLRGGETIPLEVQVIRLTERLAIVMLPGEVFVDLGLRIKQESPFETTLVVELANDAPGYIPTRKAFAEGSYETVNSRVVPGSGEMMVETAHSLLTELAADTPSPAK